MYWDATSKTYIPVPGGNPAATQPMTMTAEDQAILSNPAADAPLEMKKTAPVPPNSTAAAPAPVPTPDADPAPEPVPTSSAAPERKDNDDDDSKKDKEKDKEDKPRSLAAVKVALQLQFLCIKCQIQLCNGEIVETFVAVCRS